MSQRVRRRQLFDSVRICVERTQLRGGRRFDPCRAHHPVRRDRTSTDIRAFVPRNAGFSSRPSSLHRSLRDEKAVFTRPSLHLKFPFLTHLRDWFDDWVVGSQFRSIPSPPSSPYEPGNSRYRFKPIWVSAGVSRLRRRFEGVSLHIQKSRSWRTRLARRHAGLPNGNQTTAARQSRSRKCAISSSTDALDDLVAAGAVRCLPRIASCRLIRSARFGC
jgi:hypothetical protein